MLFSIIVIGTLAIPRAFADCECGYTVNSTSSPHFTVFTDLFETDFLHIKDVTWNSTHNVGWIPQAYTVSPSAARGPYGKVAETRNIQPNPLASEYDWGGAGVINGGDPGLRLVVSSTLTINNSASFIPMAEIVASRTDMLYGSFRVGMKLTTVSGTCGAWFWYRNDSCEIDNEFLSREQNSSSHLVNLVLQTAASTEAGFDANGTQDFHVQELTAAPGDGYHEYRFDWTPETVRFYVDGEPMWEFSESVPDSPGRVMLNHWSNGDPNWSGGPPLEDAIMVVSYVKAYFNSSDTSRTANYEALCGDETSEVLRKTCQIPDQMSPPSPIGDQGNTTGKTYFFTLDTNKTSGGQTIFPDAIPGKKSSANRLGYAEWAHYMFIALSLSCFGLFSLQ